MKVENMRSLIRSTCIAAICAVVPVVSSGPVMAAPSGALLSPIAAVAAVSSQFETVKYRRHGSRRAIGLRRGGRYGNYRRNRSRGHYGRNAGIGIGAAIIGGVILSEAARSAHRHNHSSDWARCESTYRSFESRTGMYTGNDGIRRTCPYLR